MVPVEVALASIRAALDHVDPDRTRLAPEARLRMATTARNLTGRLDALASVLLGEADRANASERSMGTPLSSYLAVDQNLTRREAAGQVHRAAALAAHPILGEAAVAGRVKAGQVRVISSALDAMAPQLDAAQQARAEERYVGLAASLDSDALAKAAPRVLAEVAPKNADESLETRLQREAEAAHESRSLRFWRQAGSVRFEGSLSRLAGEQFIALVDAHLEALRRTAVEARDPGYAANTPEQRRADALANLLRAASASRPERGVGVAQVVVKLDYDQLRAGAVGAGVVGDGAQLSAGELRRVCCDADLIPVVLPRRQRSARRGPNKRLVTPAIKTALLVRDGGCVLPGCTEPPAGCEAHHITPWWAGGETKLTNLVLLCHRHHALIEPARYALRDQWQVQIGVDHLPEILPPSRHPQAGQWLRHSRLCMERTAS